MKRINGNSGGGDLPKIVGFAKVRSMEPGASVSGEFKGQLTTKGEYPKVNYLIQLALPFSFKTYDSATKGEIVVDANPGDVIALETTTILAAHMTPERIGQTLTVVYEGKSKTKKPGQRPAYLVGLYEGLPEQAEQEAAPVKATAPVKKASGFPFNS